MTYSMPLHTRYGTSHTGTENLAVNPSKGHWRCPWSWTVTGAVHGANMHLPRCSCFGSHEALCLGNTICPVQTHAVSHHTPQGARPCLPSHVAVPWSLPWLEVARWPRCRHVLPGVCCRPHEPCRPCSRLQQRGCEHVSARQIKGRPSANKDSEDEVALWFRGSAV